MINSRGAVIKVETEGGADSPAPSGRKLGH